MSCRDSGSTQGRQRQFRQGARRVHYKLPMGGKMSTCACGNSGAVWTSADADVDADADRVHIPCAWHAC